MTEHPKLYCEVIDKLDGAENASHQIMKMLRDIRLKSPLDIVQISTATAYLDIATTCIRFAISTLGRTTNSAWETKND